MKNGQANFAWVGSRQAQVSIFPATRNLFFLIFTRISYKFWGITILSISISLAVVYSNKITPELAGNFSTMEHFSPPTSIQTIESPIAKKVAEADLLEAQGLVQTPSGLLPFSRKLTVFSTSYDKNCPGCSSTTALGLKTGYGVVAVDPNVIPLGSKLYIPGYGTAVAGDTGEAIKGAKIDLGFDNVKNGWWSARFVEIYVLK